MRGIKMKIEVDYCWLKYRIFCKWNFRIDFIVLQELVIIWMWRKLLIYGNIGLVEVKGSRLLTVRRRGKLGEFWEGW